MLFLVFQLGSDRYAIRASAVAEVLPLVNVKQIPQAPASIAGVFDYHGQPVPLIDLSQLALNSPSRKWMSSRIILVNYVRSSERHLLGLLAERATTTLRREDNDFAAAGVANPDARYLGPVTMDDLGIVQRVEIDNLLSEDLADRLFRESIGVVR
jgi:chemotaxis-related protein WspB